MDQVSDEVLLQMMQYLEVPDLFACRLVCKRLGALALHQTVWCEREISNKPSWVPWKTFRVVGWVCPVLRVVPCLHHLEVHLPPDKPLCQLMYAATTCAVRHLTVHLNGRGATLAALMIRHQEALGRLKGVTVNLREMDAVEASILLATVASTSGLRWLEISGIPEGGPNMASLVQHFTAQSSSSLRNFTCTLSPGSASFCNFILAEHAATLKEVDIAGTCEFGKPPASILTFTSMAAILAAGLPNLRKLVCPMLPGLDAVASSLSLEELTLVVRPEHQAGAQSAAMLLCRAGQLRAVTLEYEPPACGPADVGVGLVLALAASGQSNLQALTIDNSCFDFPQAQPLLSALPLMPALRHLELSTTPDEVLLGITPATTPALQTLALRAPKRIKGRGFRLTECTHGWLHNDAVGELLSINPSLQLLAGFFEKPRDYCKFMTCGPCELGCHAELKQESYKRGVPLMSGKWTVIPRISE